MNHFATDLVQSLVTKQDVTEIFRIHLENAMNHLLETKLTAFLDYEKYDRNGEFKQQTVAPYKRSNNTLESFVIHILI